MLFPSGPLPATSLCPCAHSQGSAMSRIMVNRWTHVAWRSCYVSRLQCPRWWAERRAPLGSISFSSPAFQMEKLWPRGMICSPRFTQHIRGIPGWKPAFWFVTKRIAGLDSEKLILVSVQKALIGHLTLSSCSNPWSLESLFVTWRWKYPSSQGCEKHQMRPHMKVPRARPLSKCLSGPLHVKSIDGSR